MSRSVPRSKAILLRFEATLPARGVVGVCRLSPIYGLRSPSELSHKVLQVD
jgi:hypothetical protein